MTEHPEVDFVQIVLNYYDWESPFIQSKKGNRMETILLNNGVEMPLAGLGTWNLRGQECTKTVAKAIELGYRLIDTAQMYGNETEVGKGIAQSSLPREQIFVTTKIYRISSSYDKAKKAIDESLKRICCFYMSRTRRDRKCTGLWRKPIRKGKPAPLEFPIMTNGGIQNF